MSDVVPEQFRDLLSHVVAEKIDNYTVNIVEGSLQGENFLSEIIFVSLENKTTHECIHLVVKKALENLDQPGYFRHAYTREIYFYEYVWPLFNKFQESKLLGFNKIPKCYTISKAPGEEKLVMEDLLKQNFQLFDKTQAFDKNHMELIFKCYGTFHAISTTFKEKYPEKFAEISTTLGKYTYHGENTEQDKAYVKNIFDNVDYVLNLFKEDNDIAMCKAIENIKANVFQYFAEWVNDTDPLVLLHGDCWSNNMLFQYDVSKMNFITNTFRNHHTSALQVYCFYNLYQ